MSLEPIPTDEDIKMIISKLESIESRSFDEAGAIISEICRNDIKLSLKEIEFILHMKEKELINIFFYEYSLFDQKDFVFVEGFINSNLDHENRDFVSDLIYIALDFALDLNYKKILSFLKTEKEDVDLIILASLEYLHKNIKLLYVEELTEGLEYVRNHAVYYQNEQLLASLILYRITYKEHYLLFIKELLESDDSNLKYLQNILKGEMYSDTYFNNIEIQKIVNIKE